MKFIKIPLLIKWILAIAFTFLTLMTLLRLAFFIYFKEETHPFVNSVDAFVLGLRYDLRTVCAIVVPLFLLGSLNLKFNRKKRLTLSSCLYLLLIVAFMVAFILYLKSIHSGTYLLVIVSILFAVFIVLLFKFKTGNPFINSSARTIWKLYFLVITVFLLFFYAIDFQYYDYLHQRLNASVFNYAEDVSISAKMVWQTYPVVKLLLGLILIIWLMMWIINTWYKRIDSTSVTLNKKINLLTQIILFFLLAFAIFGRAGQYPLRWSDAFALANDYKANLALNPIQSFFSTLQFRNSTYDLKKVKQYYSLMASHLNVQHPDSLQLNYQRQYLSSTKKKIIKPNVVVVICESFSAYKSSMWGNVLNATPYFNELCKQGIFFDHCFTPSYGTARGVWAVITGEPDVESPRTASRNPAVVDQHTIINELPGYDKFYFLGGSTSWANIRAVLTNNIIGLNLYDEGSYKANSIDVWGISDKNLFLEANQVLKQQQKSFFALIQTADNHRPYTIPPEDKEEFTLKQYSQDSLETHGFDNNKEFNAFRYTDFCFQKFMEAAKKEKYFDNTIFVFVGDHGIPGNAADMFPKCWSEMGLTAHHVPLLFYSPLLQQPQRINGTCSQLDILPSIASLLNVSYHNTTLGRDLFDTTQNTRQFAENAFLFKPDERKIGMVTNKYCYMKEIETGKESFASTINNQPLPLTPQIMNDKKILQNLSDAYYETAKYMLRNNFKKSVAQ